MPIRLHGQSRETQPMILIPRRRKTSQTSVLTLAWNQNCG